MPGADPTSRSPEGTEPGDDDIRYDIIGRLADGAMGQVYLARLKDDAGPALHLVLKRIRPELQADADIVLMFQDEARLASQLEHANIVRLYEVGALDGSLFLAMELVEGITVEHLLSTLVEQRRFIPIELALTVAIGILNALDYAHAFADDAGRPLNIVHRDVSPQNLMVSYGGDVKLLDFGVTRAEGRLHQTLPGLLKGKLAYMAPETVEGRLIDARADLFSLGAVLYELLLLKHPFFGSTDAMVLRSIMEEPPVHPAELDPTFPEPLAQILLGALAKDPDHRVASAADMRAQIEAYLAGAGLADRGGEKALGAFLRELYADRVELHQHAKTVGDDALLLQALRGFVRRPNRGAAVLSTANPKTPEPTGPYAVPHSLVELDYARVPTADLPVLRRSVDIAPEVLRRSSVDEVLVNAYGEPTESANARAFEAQLGRYQLLEVLEQSALRYLQRARLIGPLGFAKDVMLRRLPPDRVADPEWIAPLVREAKVRANLNHPHVEMLLDFQEDPEVHFAVEPLDGWGLDQILSMAARGHRSPPRLDIAVRLILDIVDALEHLHGLPEPILHRGVEPSAVNLYRTGRAKLTNFDVARPVGARSPHIFEPRRNTLDRLAPETVAPERGAEGVQTDVYGATLLLTECLTLTRPFLRDEPTSVVQAVLHGVDDSVLQDVPAPVRPIAERGLAVDPAYRFPDMAALRRALLEVASAADRATVRDWFARG